MEPPFSRFDLGVLVRGCVECGAQLVPAGRVRYDGDDMPLMLSAQMPRTLHGTEFLLLKCPSGCVGHNLIFARGADGTPHFFSEPYDLPDRGGRTRMRHDTPNESTRRIAIEYDDRGLVKTMVETRSGVGATPEKALFADPLFQGQFTAALEPTRRPAGRATTRTTEPTEWK